MNRYLNILGINIRNSTYHELIFKLKRLLYSREKYSFLNVNSYIILMANKNKKLKNYLDNFSDLYCDGMGVYLASKMLYFKNSLRQRITGTDLYYQILAFANEMNAKIFFFGGSNEATQNIKKTLTGKYPNINITGIVSRRKIFNDDLIKRINNTHSDILFVGLGTPYQEEFVSLYSESLNVPLQIAVGSGIEFLSSSKKRAPVLLQRLGLEWFYRLYLEPKRLWKRYILGIPVFIFKVLCFKVRLLLNKS